LATSKDWDMLLPANDPAFPWTMYLGGAICTSVFYCATNQFIVQRTLAAKSEWHARMGVVFADYLKFIIPFMIIGPALVAAKMFPNLEKADLVFPTLVKNLLPSGLVGLVMAGLIAAIMSHLSGAINSCTTILTMDVYLPYFKKSASETQSVMFGKISGAVIVVLGIMCTSLLMSHSDKPVFLYLLNAYGLFTPGIATMFLMGTLSKRTTHAGALTAGLLTVPMSIVMQLIWPDMPFYNRTGIVFWTCMAVCMAVSYAGVPKTAAELEGLIWSRSSLSLPLDERHQQRGLRNPFIWWLIVTAMVLFFYIRFA
ncbi:MAG: sodium transporter, partial [Sphingobacteriaceae bacterium]|nr:sodium transporter [Sphingobacteriaceae bacterium]